MALKVAPKKVATEDPRHTQAVQSYESGLRALQERKFDKAKGHLQKVLAGPNKSLVDRAQVHILTCDKHLDTPALHCLTGHIDESLKMLNEAIQVKPSLRFQARNDTDFQNLAEDPRFTELLYPDPGAGESEPHEKEASAY